MKNVSKTPLPLVSSTAISNRPVSVRIEPVVDSPLPSISACFELGRGLDRYHPAAAELDDHGLPVLAGRITSDQRASLAAQSAS